MAAPARAMVAAPPKGRRRPWPAAKGFEALTLRLRARHRLLRHALPASLADALAIAPALFVCSFDAPGLKTDAPGVEALRPSPRWAAVARRLKLPALIAPQQSRRLVGAVLACAKADELTIYVQPAEVLAAPIVAALTERCRVVNALLQNAKVPLTFELLSRGTLEPKSLAFVSTFAALIAGRPAPWLCQALDEASRTVTPALLLEWAPLGATQLTRTLLVLCGSAPAAPELDVAATLAGRESDFEQALAQLAFASGVGPVALELVAAAASAPGTRRRAMAQCFGPPPLPAMSAAAVAKVARELTMALTAAVRRRPVHERRAVAEVVRAELSGGPAPRSLISALKAALPNPRRADAMRVTAHQVGSWLQLQLPDGTVIARARTLLQARVRAMLLAQALWGHVPTEWLTGQQWRRVQDKLLQRPVRRTWLLALGPTFTSWSLRLAPGREPRVRELDGQHTLERVLVAAGRQEQLEVLPLSPEQERDAMWLKQLAYRAAQAQLGTQVAVRYEKKVLVYKSGRVRRFSLRAFSLRPREVLRLDAAPTKPSSALGPTIECDAALVGERVRLDYRDGALAFREWVPFQMVRRHLEVGEQICRTSAHRSLLVVREDDALRHRNQVGRVSDLPRCELAVEGDLVRGLVVVVDGERFTSFRAAAQQVLSHWQVGVRGLLDVRSVNVSLKGLPTEGLPQLYARARALRRLNAHIDACVGLKGSRQRVDE